MKKFRIGIITVNRVTNSSRPQLRENKNSENYIYETLLSFEEAGFMTKENFKVCLFDSGSDDISYLDEVKEKWPDLEISYSDKNLTLNENSDKAMLWAHQDSDFAVLMQDDIKFSKDAARHMEGWVYASPKNANILTLWNTLPGKKDEYVTIQADGFWGSVFLIWPSKQARRYLAWDDRRKVGTGHDMSVKQWLKIAHGNVYANSKGLIDHTGLYSTIGNREDRRNKQFKP